jgi:hypothetical protein
MKLTMKPTDWTLPNANACRCLHGDVPVQLVPSINIHVKLANSKIQLVRQVTAKGKRVGGHLRRETSTFGSFQIGTSEVGHS